MSPDLKKSRNLISKYHSGLFCFCFDELCLLELLIFIIIFFKSLFVCLFLSAFLFFFFIVM